MPQRWHHRVAHCSEQCAHWHDGVAAGVQPIQNSRERLHRLRAVAPGVVKQNDAAVAPLLLHALHDDVGTGFRPVLRIDVFQNDEVIEVLRDLQRRQFGHLRWARVGGIGRPK